MPVSRDQVEQQLKALGGFHTFFTSKELRYLPEILTENETIHGVTSGYYNSKTWIIVITDMRLLFLDKSMLYGLKQVDLPLAQITSVSQETRLFFGEIRVTASSGVQAIGAIPKKDVTKLCSTIAGLIHSSKKGGSRPAEKPDIASQLEKLFSLREKGALTDDEYCLLKERLLEPPQSL